MTRPVSRQETVSVGECVEWWLEAQRPRLREFTWHDYREKARYYVLPALGRLPMVELRTEHLIRLYRRMLMRGLSQRTVRYTHQILQHVSQHAVELGLIGANPAPGARPGWSSPRPPASLTPPELDRFLRVARTSEHGALWLLLSATGMRPSEAMGLTWDDLDLKRRRLRVAATLRFLPGGRFERHPVRHSGQRREVMLPVHVAKALRAHRTRQHRMRREAGMLWQDHRFLFTDGEGRPLQWKTLTRRHLRGLLDKAGLPQVSGYSLRHACVAAMVRRGVRLEALARQTGYTRIGTVLDSRGVSRS